eukprot:CAMPEP_0201286020 /NCGR_PEP_ID=MMETSP1317-20130820/114164_1 /ASSEMBLY_ACC=CAM_ASM_000770 /TAXON_ID=187299 /ORGANISM="Undescribed Undescribed, Strain Undescribed" /LENGTH=31 /DNA_ID= /DNA_START= /DNA_END= /DNA_ORIENTATION=
MTFTALPLMIKGVFERDVDPCESKELRSFYP